MKRVLCLAAIVISSCAYIPKVSHPLNDPDVFSQSDFNKNGVLAFVPIYQVNTDVKMELDMLNADSNKTYRISLTPSLKSFSTVNVLGKTVYKSEIERSEISDTVALYALPPGKYITKFTYAYFGNNRSSTGFVTENEIIIEPNKITSLGQTLIPFEAKLFSATIPTIKTLDTNTVELIKKCKLPISQMEIRSIVVDIKAK